MAKKSKSSNNSKVTCDNPNDHTWYERFKNMGSWNNTDLGPMFIEKLCIKLMSWADREDSHYVEDFLCDNGIPEQTFYFWLHKYPDIKNANEYALNRLASRKQRTLELFNPQNIAFTLPSYSKRWAACEEYKAKLKAGNPDATVANLTTFISELEILMEEKYANEPGNQRKDETVCTKTLPVENNRSD